MLHALTWIVGGLLLGLYNTTTCRGAVCEAITRDSSCSALVIYINVLYSSHDLPLYWLSYQQVQASEKDEGCANRWCSSTVNNIIIGCWNNNTGQCYDAANRKHRERERKRERGGELLLRNAMFYYINILITQHHCITWALSLTYTNALTHPPTHTHAPTHAHTSTHPSDSTVNPANQINWETGYNRSFFAALK